MAAPKPQQLELFWEFFETQKHVAPCDCELSEPEQCTSLSSRPLLFEQETTIQLQDMFQYRESGYTVYP